MITFILIFNFILHHQIQTVMHNFFILSQCCAFCERLVIKRKKFVRPTLALSRLYVSSREGDGGNPDPESNLPTLLIWIILAVRHVSLEQGESPPMLKLFQKRLTQVIDVVSTPAPPSGKQIWWGQNY